MKRKNLWFFLLVILSLVSCNDNTYDDFNKSSLNESLFLNLNIISDSDPSTKAGSDGDNIFYREDGSFLENYIDIENNDFHIVIFNSSGDFITEFKGEEVAFKNENNEEATHSLGIEIKDDKLQKFPSNILTEEFTVIVLANWKSFTGKDYTTFEGKNIKNGVTGNIYTENSFYDFDYAGKQGETWYPSIAENSFSLIPMVGIAKFSGFTYSQSTGILTANSSVLMVRSLAKITISLKDELWRSGFEISSCKLNKYAFKGRIIPDLSKEGNTLQKERIIDITLPWDTRGVEKTDPIFFVKIGEDGKNPILTSYVPEMFTAHYNILSGDRPRLTAALTLNNENFKDNKDFELNDNLSSSTQLFHILRNHHYNFIIEDITEKGEIILSYTVCPWDKGSVDIGFH
ncbi:MAG: hypothetical protein J1F12_06325 [Muribaculaceae bacterium]|nr:hypothetical protein [Muribaculaceae bacterium]